MASLITFGRLYFPPLWVVVLRGVPRKFQAASGCQGISVEIGGQLDFVVLGYIATYRNSVPFLFRLPFSLSSFSFFSYLFVHFEQNVFIYHPISFLRSLVIHRTWIAMLVCATRAMFSSLVLTNMGCWIGKAIDYAQKCITRLHVVWMEEDGVRVCITTQRGA